MSEDQNGGNVMERLTFDGNFCDISQCTSTPGGSLCEDGSCSARKVWERLKAYEATGLEPAMCANYKTFEDEAISKGVTFKRIVALMEADKDGRLVVLGHPRRRVMWGDVEPDRLLCPECGNDLAGGFLEQASANLEMVNCPYCGEYLNLGRKTEAEKALEAMK